MPTRRLPSPTTGKLVDAEVVDIVDISDPPIRITLEDGTRLRLKTDVIEIARFQGEWDRDGHPLYNVKSANFVAVLESSEHLQKDAATKRIQ